MLEHDTSETIFALSSAKGRSAVSLHRISGPSALKTVIPLLRHPDFQIASANTKWQQKVDLRPSVSKYCFLVSEDGEIIDDCLVTYFKAPHSYTGEDTIEIGSHGNPLIIAKLHSTLRQLGMREAKPGEFTQRAYLNGKMDLTRAEAIDQLIHADTYAGIALARQASEGRIAEVALKIRQRLTSAMAYFEAHIDFADDEVGNYDSRSQMLLLSDIRNELKRLMESFSVGLKIREGLRVAFVGVPNAGKSSLYNALLGYERAIVTDIPGTTRDVLEDRLVLNKRDFILLDTAGIRETADTVEKIGVERTWNSAKGADIICLVIDPTQHQAATIEETVFQQAKDLLDPLHAFGISNAVVVLTKEDCWTEKQKAEWTRFKNQEQNFNFALCKTSASKPEIGALTALLESVHDRLFSLEQNQESAILISERQRDKVALALRSLDTAISLVSENDFPEKVASMLIQTAQHVSEIVGEIGTEDVLNDIFANFCIGK
ncbi:MAG: hypothetical protein RLZZ488_1438 [Pseudomonadota bacterium]|jgi:tRNA modification GTPase